MGPDPEEKRNMIIFFVLTAVILLGYMLYNFYFVEPKQRAILAQQQAAQKKEYTVERPEELSANDDSLSQKVKKENVSNSVIQQYETAKKIKVKTSSLEGSISTLGANFDNLSLNNYYETSENKDKVQLLSQLGSENYYHATFNWQHAKDDNTILPNAQTLWNSDSTLLTPESPITLWWDNGEGVRFFLDVSVDDKYLFTVKQRVENNSNRVVKLYPYSLVSRNNIPTSDVRVSYVLFQGLVGVLDGKLEEVTFDDALDGDNIRSPSSKGGWVGITSKYWLVALASKNGDKVYGRLSGDNGGASPSFQADLIESKYQTISPNGGVAQKESYLFAGAKDYDSLNMYKKEVGIERFDDAIDWGWYWFFTKPFFWLLHLFYKTFGYMGLAILCVTLVVKTFMFPLANKSYRSMNRMKELSPRIKEIQESCGDDKTKAQQEIMALYKREKVSPASGCLPMIVQIPVFYSLYKVLYVSIELRHQPFWWWIKDLTAPDPTSIWNLFGLIPYDINLFFTIPAFLTLGAWPIMLGFSMWFQQRLNPQPTDATQAKIFAWMPFVFTLMLGSFPVGLVIYWTWNNLLTICQQLLIKRLYSKSAGKKDKKK